MMEMHEASGSSATNVQPDCGSGAVCNNTYCGSNADCISNNCCLPTSANWNAANGNCDPLPSPALNKKTHVNSCQGVNTEPNNFWNGGSWRVTGSRARTPSR